MGTERSGFNNLTLQIYQSFSTTLVLDAADDLNRAQNLVFDQIYPGGLASSMTFTVMRDPTRSWPFKQGQRIVARNGLAIVWEGEITSPGFFEDATTGGRIISAIGWWGRYLGAAGMRKAWADNRIGANVWVPQSGTAMNKCTVNQTASAIVFVPKSEKWNTGDVAFLYYFAPTGVTVKRVTFHYDMSVLSTVAPSLVIYFQVSGTAYTKETNLYDGSASTGVTFDTFITTDFLYVGMNAGDTDKVPAGDTVRMSVTMGATVNAVASVLAVTYWTGAAWAAVGSLVDGTASVGKTLAQSGVITFTRPGDWAATPLADANKSSKMWVRLAVSVNLTASIIIDEITFGENQNWQLQLWEGSDGVTDTINTTSSGSIDRTFITPNNAVQLWFSTTAQNTPWSNGSVYVKITALVVYCDATNPLITDEIARNWVSCLANIGGAGLGNLSTDTSQIDPLVTNTLSVVPWMTGTNVDWETAQANLSRLAALGDQSFNAWACYLLDSEHTASPNGKPVMAYQQQPALTDYDYAVTLGPGTLQSISLAQTPVFNDIIVSYVDTSGVTQWRTSADNSGLTDAASVALYGRFQVSLQANTTSSAIADTLGQRYLAQNKDPHVYVNGSIPVTGYLLGKNGNPVPAANVTAGKRLKVLNFLTDEVGVGAAGLTFLISHTSYDDTSETVTIDTGLPDNLAIMIARLVAFPGRGLA